MSSVIVIMNYVIANGTPAHTVVILIILLMFAFVAYATNEHLGSPGKVFDLLVEAAKNHPVEGNAGGSYLTMRSKEGAIFFVINIVGNFGTVFCGCMSSTIRKTITHCVQVTTDTTTKPLPRPQ